MDLRRLFSAAVLGGVVGLAIGYVSAKQLTLPLISISWSRVLGLPSSTGDALVWAIGGIIVAVAGVSCFASDPQNRKSASTTKRRKLLFHSERGIFKISLA